VTDIVVAELLAIVLVVALVALATVAIPVRPGRPPRGEQGTDPRRWRGVVYLNPDDPRLFVPKRVGVGWTVNFGHPWAWRILALMLGVLVLSVTLGTLFERSGSPAQ
jgi:uncharacterized membrane protein